MGAVLSDCGTYRYVLWREIQQPLTAETGDFDADETCLFVMLNPSTADATQDDPTIRRCIGFARSWGFGRIAVANLYALRSTDPAALAAHSDPVGPDNDDWIRKLVGDASLTVAAWGASRYVENRRMVKVLAILARMDVPLVCLGRTKGGRPRHPLYVRAATEPEAVCREIAA